MPLIAVIVPWALLATPPCEEIGVEAGVGLPIGIVSTPSPSGASAEILTTAGVRASAALLMDGWVLGAELGLHASLPDRRGTDVVSVVAQEDHAALGLRLGYRLSARQFALEPFAVAQVAGGVRLVSLAVNDEDQLHARPLLGVGGGGGVLAGYRWARLRLDLVVRATPVAPVVATTLTVGVAFP